ncbi:hypothetical protein AK812_SmicGene24034 [Symbiodinium microadriaticum]|uniref:Uncharacterized protein n=1 Tax=Symbiodinium microadriaticum TaxID=2951 RepID=A0A1Q9DFR0_SYMMI|nr:hypothetical protein AK812_SmicGene24034 [Symbiodinium microadriaticum]
MLTKGFHEGHAYLAYTRIPAPGMKKVMELCNEGSVSDVLRKLQGPLSEKEIRIITREVADAESLGEP